MAAISASDQLAEERPAFLESMLSWQGLFCFFALYPCSRALAYAINSTVMPMRIRMFTFLVVSATQLLSLATFLRNDHYNAKELREFQEGCTLAISYFYIWLLIHTSVNALVPSLHDVTSGASNAYTGFFVVHTLIIFRIYQNVNAYTADYHVCLLVFAHAFMCGIIATIYVFHHKHREVDMYETEDEALYDIMARRASFLMLVYYVLFAIGYINFLMIANAIGESSLVLETTMYALVIVGAPLFLCAVIRPAQADEEEIPIRERMEGYESLD